jgi:hypothetical protein
LTIVYEAAKVITAFFCPEEVALAAAGARGRPPAAERSCGSVERLVLLRLALGPSFFADERNETTLAVPSHAERVTLARHGEELLNASPANGNDELASRRKLVVSTRGTRCACVARMAS